MTTRPPSDALRGSLDLLVLKTLSLQPMHGWGISQRVQQISDGVLEVNQGSLYPALQRLEKEGLITSEWGTTDNDWRARSATLNLRADAVNTIAIVPNTTSGGFRLIHIPRCS